MDCEKFDEVAIDALDDELDELTMAAAKRHADTCPQCAALWSGLKATRKLGVLPVVSVPAGFEQRIVRAARDAQRHVPWTRRASRAISWAGSYAMRPQTAMAAILLLMLGSSVIFVRVKPDRSAPNHVSVTERGEPEQPTEEVRPPPGIPLDLRPAPLPARAARREDDRASGASAPPSPTGAIALAAPNAPAPREAPLSAEAKPRYRPVDPGAVVAPSTVFGLDEGPGSGASDDGRFSRAPGAIAALRVAPAAAPSGASDAYLAAMELYNTGRYAEAERAFGDVASAGARNAASASLYAAKSAEAGVGCSRAAAKYESTASRYGATTPGAEALWAAANCYKALGSLDKARQLYLVLRSVAGYRDRAEGELASLSALRQQQLIATKAKAAGRPAPAGAGAAAAEAESRPAAAAPAAPPAAATKPAAE